MRSELTAQLVAYECGTLDETEVCALFQELVDTGLAWKFQGAYGRMAIHLIEQGMIVDRRFSTVH